MPKADMTPATINNLRNGFLQKAQVDRTVQNNLSDRLQNQLTADTAELSGSNRGTKKEVSSGDSTRRPSNTVAPDTTKADGGSATKPESVEGTTVQPPAVEAKLQPSHTDGSPGAGLLSGSGTGTATTEGAATASSGTTASAVDPNSATTSTADSGTSTSSTNGTAQQAGQPSQTEEMQRKQMIENDALQARTIYAQIAADRQKAFYKMMEILNQARVDTFASLQAIMVNKAKSVETANANFSKYLQM